MRRINDHIEELHFLDLAGRLAARLVRLAQEEDPGATGPVELRLALSQGDLAAMVGRARQNVNRLLPSLTTSRGPTA